MRKFLNVVLATALAFGLIACSNSKSTTSGSARTSQNNDKVYIYKLGHTGAPTHHYHQISEMYAEEVGKRSNGQIKITVHPSDQLGNQMESIEGTMVGTQDMILTSDMALSNWVPEVGIFNLPYIFRDDEHTRIVFDGPIGEEFSKLVEPTGAIVLGWWDGGLRHVTNSKRVIKTPADLEGLKIRVPEGAVYLETFKAMGATPTVISFSELYSALQLKTVDAQENPPAHILSQKFYEVQPYCSRIAHIRSSSPLLVNKEKFESMPLELQSIMIEAAKEMGAKHNEIVAELEIGQWEELKNYGVAIYDPDKTPFIEAVQPVYDLFKEKLGSDLIDIVRNAK